jgi:hypothetical protein
MGYSINVETDCLFVGEFVEDMELPAGQTASVGHVQETEFLGTFVENWPAEVDTIDFKILLRDGRTVTVRGHALQYLPNPSNPSDAATYGILGYTGLGEVLVALFPASEVTGVFTGGFDSPRASA